MREAGAGSVPRGQGEQPAGRVKSGGDRTGHPHFPATARKNSSGISPYLPHLHPWVYRKCFRALLGALALFTPFFFFLCYLNAIKNESAKVKRDAGEFGVPTRGDTRAGQDPAGCEQCPELGESVPLSPALDSRSLASAAAGEPRERERGAGKGGRKGC